MAVESVNPSAQGYQNTTPNSTGVPSAEDEDTFKSLLAENKQIMPERNLIQLLHHSGLFLRDQTEAMSRSRSLGPKETVKMQLLMAEFQIAYNFGAKVVGSISQSLNKLDTMS